MLKKHRTGNLFQRGNVWWLRYMVEGKLIQQSLNTNDSNEAEAKRQEIMKPIMAGSRADALAIVHAKLTDAKTEAQTIHDEKNPPLEIKRAWAAYLKNQERPQSGPETLRQYENHWTVFSAWMEKEHSETRLLRDVTNDMAGAFIRYLTGARQLSGGRINKYIRFLKTFCRVLAEQARATSNPFEKISTRRHISKTRRPLTIEELKHIIETATGELKTLFMLGTFTGLRLADCATLLWQEVDLHRGIIRRIPRKTSRSEVAVKPGIPDILAEHLAELPRKSSYIVPGMADLHSRDNSKLSKNIARHMGQCGIQTTQDGTGKGTDKRPVILAGFHSLRHTYISIHAQAGTPQTVLQKLAGHKNPMMTEHYVHLSEASAVSAARAFPAIMREDPKALPAPATVSADRVLAMLDRMNSKNWKAVRDEMRELAK